MVYKIMHNDTGPWTGCNYADTAKYTTGGEGKIFTLETDREILRRLASKVADLVVPEIVKDYIRKKMVKEMEITKVCVV